MEGAPKKNNAEMGRRGLLRGVMGLGVATTAGSFAENADASAKKKKTPEKPLPQLEKIETLNHEIQTIGDTYVDLLVEWEAVSTATQTDFRTGPSLTRYQSRLRDTYSIILATVDSVHTAVTDETEIFRVELTKFDRLMEKNDLEAAEKVKIKMRAQLNNLLSFSNEAKRSPLMQEYLQEVEDNTAKRKRI